MHKYLYHIGDFMRDTVHLSAQEECFYRRALDFYYLNESPLPIETQVVFRRLRANTEEEKQSVLNVLSDFFTEEEDGFHNKRCDAEIAAYKKKGEVNRSNGGKGGRPKKVVTEPKPKVEDSDSLENPQKTQSVILGSENESQKNLNHKPLTDNQFNSSSNTHEEKKSFPPIQFSTYQVEDHKRYSLLGLADQYSIQNDFLELAKTRFENIPTQDLISMFQGGGQFCDFFSAKSNSTENTPSLWLVKWFTWVENNKDQTKRNREKQIILAKRSEQPTGQQQTGYFSNIFQEQRGASEIDVTPETGVVHYA